MSVEHPLTRNKKRGTTELFDAAAGLMQCGVCGHCWMVSIRGGSGGKLYRGSWQCPNGCNKSEVSDGK